MAYKRARRRNAFILSSAKNNYQICWPFSVLFFVKKKQRQWRRAYHEGYTTIFCGRRVSSKGNAVAQKNWNACRMPKIIIVKAQIQKDFWNVENFKVISEIIFFVSVSDQVWSMYSERCHVLYDSIRPLALLISSHVSCKRPSFVRKSNKRRGKAKREKKMWKLTSLHLSFPKETFSLETYKNCKMDGENLHWRLQRGEKHRIEWKVSRVFYNHCVFKNENISIDYMVYLRNRIPDSPG